MIFRIDKKAFINMDERKRSVFFHAVRRNHHIIKCDDQAVREDIIESLGLRPPDNRAVMKSLFDLNHEQLRYLTTINVADYKNIDQLIVLSGEKARLMIENGPYEWPIYKELARAYKKDSTYGNVAGWIYNAIDRHELYCLHGGGVGTFDALIELEEKEVYVDHTFAQKHVIIFDRDTTSPNNYDSQQNPLFRRFLEKDSVKVNDSDIYSVNQKGIYIWHVWYKRAIENYFSNDRYQNLGVGTSRVPKDQNERDYCKMDSSRDKEDSSKDGCLDNYSKRMMAKIAKGMTYRDFEKNLKRFMISISGNTVKISEFQLLLLKIAKII